MFTQQPHFVHFAVIHMDKTQQQVLPHPHQGKEKEVILFFSWKLMPGFRVSMYINAAIFHSIY